MVILTLHQRPNGLLHGYNAYPWAGSPLSVAMLNFNTIILRSQVENTSPLSERDMSLFVSIGNSSLKTFNTNRIVNWKFNTFHLCFRTIRLEHITFVFLRSLLVFCHLVQFSITSDLLSSSSVLAMMTKSSANNNSRGYPTPNSRGKAFMTMTNSGM